MPILERLVVKFDADFAELDRAFGKAEQRVTRGGEKMARVGGMLTLGVTLPLVALGAAAVKASSDAEEAGNKFDTVFGTAAERATKRIDELHETIPAATADLVAMAASLQDLLKPLGLATEAAADMSLETLELAGDLASFNDVAISEVLMAIRSGFVGQSEPLLRFGADVRVAAVKTKALELGLMSLGGTLTNTARAQAVLAIVTESNTDAIGDAAKTADSTANSIKFLTREFKDMGDTIGDILIPVVLPLVTGLTGLLGAFADMPPFAQNTAVAFAGVVAALGPLLVMAGLALPALAGIATAMTIGLTPVVLYAAGVVAALGLAGGAMLSFAQDAKAASDAAAGLDKSFETRSAEKFADMETDAIEKRIEGLKRTQDTLRETLDLDRQNMTLHAGLAVTTRELAAAEAELAERRAGQVVAPLMDNAELEVSVDNMERLVDRAESLADSIDDARLDLQFEKDATAAEKLTLKISDMADELERVTDELARQRSIAVEKLPGFEVSGPGPIQGLGPTGVDTSRAARAELGRRTRETAAGLELLSAGFVDADDDLVDLARAARALVPEFAEMGDALSNVLAGVISGISQGGVVGLFSGFKSLLDGIFELTRSVDQNTVSTFESTRTRTARRKGLPLDPFRGFEGGQDRARIEAGLLDVTGAGEFDLLVDAASDFLPEVLGGFKLSDLELGDVGAFVGSVFGDIKDDPVAFQQLLGPDVPIDAFLDWLSSIERLGDAADDAADALSDVAGIINQPTGFKVALDRFNATNLGAAGQPGGGRDPADKNRPTGDTLIIVENITVNGDQDAGDVVMEQIRDAAEREHARGGADAFTLSLDEV